MNGQGKSLGLRINDPDFRMKYGSQLPNGEEIVSWMWFDTLSYVSGTTVRLDFFQAVNTNKVLSNMVIAGALPAPSYFVLMAIRIVPIILPQEERLTAVGVYAANAAIDIHRLLTLSRSVLTIGSKTYLDHPSSIFTAGQGIDASYGADAASGATTVYESHRISNVNNGIPDPRAVYTLQHMRLIEPQINFQFSMIWNAAVTLSGNQNVRVEFDGGLYRPIQ